MRSELVILGWKYKNGELSIENEEIRSMSILKSPYVESMGLTAFLIGYFNKDDQDMKASIDEVYGELKHLSQIVNLAKNKSTMIGCIKNYVISRMLKRNVTFTEFQMMGEILSSTQKVHTGHRVNSIW